MIPVGAASAISSMDDVDIVLRMNIVPDSEKRKINALNIEISM